MSSACISQSTLKIRARFKNQNEIRRDYLRDSTRLPTGFQRDCNEISTGLQRDSTRYSRLSRSHAAAPHTGPNLARQAASPITHTYYAQAGPQRAARHIRGTSLLSLLCLSRAAGCILCIAMLRPRASHCTRMLTLSPRVRAMGRLHPLHRHAQARRLTLHSHAHPLSPRASHGPVASFASPCSGPAPHTALACSHSPCSHPDRTRLARSCMRCHCTCAPAH